MTQRLLLLMSIIIVLSVFLIGCTENTIKDIKIDDVPYKTLYEGFVMWMDGVQTIPPKGALVFESEKEWIEFVNNYIPTLYSMTTMFDYTNFTKENIVYICSIGPQTTYDTSIKLENLVLQNKTLIPNFKKHNDDGVYALNNIERIKHPFIQVLKVNKDTIPKNLKNKYHRENYFNEYKKPNNNGIELVNINTLTVYDILAKEKRKIKEEFEWIKNIEWDEVLITKDKEQYTLKDDKIILGFIDGLYLEREVMEPHRGFISTVPEYSYTFKSDNKTFCITIMDRDIIRIDNTKLESFGKFFKVSHSNSVHFLGDAFIKEDNWRKAGNVEAKIANSGIILPKNNAFLPVFETFRKQYVAEALSSEAKRIEEPQQLSEEIESSHIAYYHGSKILINTYKNHINIIDGNSEYWYSLKDAAFKINHILHGMG